MIRCPFTRDTVIQMLAVFRDDAAIARHVSNAAYSVTTAQVRQLRQLRSQRPRTR